MKKVFPRSPREVMSGWLYLPRLVDKIRLHLAGKLPPEYHDNFLHRGFDALWCECAGVEAATLVRVVEQSITDGEVADWVRTNVHRSAADREVHRDRLLAHGTVGEELIARLRLRKEEAGLTHRDDIRTFVDFIDADEGRGAL